MRSRPLPPPWWPLWGCGQLLPSSLGGPGAGLEEALGPAGEEEGLLRATQRPSHFQRGRLPNTRVACRVGVCDAKLNQIKKNIFKCK